MSIGFPRGSEDGSHAEGLMRLQMETQEGSHLAVSLAPLQPDRVPLEFSLCFWRILCFVSVRAFLSLQSGSTTELFVFPKASGDVSAVLGLGKFMWPIFLECRFYFVEVILRITLISK